MYSVSEAAKKLNVSRVTIYRNIETEELRQYVTVKNNVKYIDNVGFDLLAENLVVTLTKNAIVTLIHQTCCMSCKC